MAPVRPWRAVVIYPSRQVERLDERRYGSAVRLPEVHRVYLEDWADVPATTVGLRLVQLLAGEAAEAPAKARQLLREPAVKDGRGLPASVLLDLVETILVYKLPTMSREEVRRMLELHDVDLNFQPAAVVVGEGFHRGPGGFISRGDSRQPTATGWMPQITL